MNATKCFCFSFSVPPSQDKERPLMYRNLLGLSVLVAALATCADGTQAGDQGWVQLFNGKDLTGWKIHPKPSPQILEVMAKEKDGKVVAYEGKLKDGMVVP